MNDGHPPHLPAVSDRRMWIMGAYGAVCGLPLPLSGFTLRQWLSEQGISLGAIGLTALIGLAYTLKFAWAPLLDRPPPGLSRLGRRRGWLALIQAPLTLACIGLALSDPNSPGPLVAIAVGLAFLSASQDIVVDAWRIELFPERSQGVALAFYVWGYRLALLVAGAGAIGLADRIGWPGALLAVAALVGCGLVITLIAPEPARTDAVVRRRSWGSAILPPLREFVRRDGAWAILAFVMLFKLGEALAHTMAVPFYRAMGFDRAQVAVANGIPSLLASLAGAAVGAILVARLGAGRALILTGFMQMASMLMYVVLASSQGDPRVLVAKVAIEAFAEAMADAAFLTYLSLLCDRAYTATQYALLSSLAAVGLRTLGGVSGFLAESLGWVPFYVLTIVAALPAMLIMVFLLRRFPPPPRPAVA